MSPGDAIGSRLAGLWQRLRGSRPPRRLRLALQGGGSHGAFTGGIACSRLLALDIESVFFPARRTLKRPQRRRGSRASSNRLASSRSAWPSAQASSKRAAAAAPSGSTWPTAAAISSARCVSLSSSAVCARGA